MAFVRRKKFNPGRKKGNSGVHHGNRYAQPAQAKEVVIGEIRQVEIPEVISVKEFADRAKLPVTVIISNLMKNGVLASINQTIDFETAAIIGDDLGLEIVRQTEIDTSLAERSSQLSGDEKDLEIRPPVVTIMGHVDHGKTTLLDTIRASHVASRESGGITQHISAYQVALTETKNKDLKGRAITFIDTPGHAAFSAMRQHGTAITDIVVLIVAANDGVMPQTKEVIEQAKNSKVPMIVAINKVDLPDADVQRVKQQLSEYDLIPEEWGGKTVMVEVSAKSGQGVDDLLEMILLQADMMELRANPSSKAIGVVIESHLQKGTGAMAVVLIENGTAKLGDPISIGSSYGKVRILEDFAGRKIPKAGPSTPVRIAGLKSLPNFGDRMIVFDDEKAAKTSSLQAKKSQSLLHVATAQKIGSTGPDEAEREVKELNLVVKSDVAGSLEAVKKLVGEINSQEVAIKIISEGVGPISESDITLAKATKAIVYGFRVPVLMAAKKIAENEKIAVKTFDVIYKLIDDIKSEASDLLPPEIIEDELGTLSVLAIFRDDKKAFVSGGRVDSGRLAVGDEIKVFQDGNEKYRDKVVSIRQGKNETKECAVGIECGFSVTPHANIAVGDKVIAFKTIIKERTIE